MTLPRDPFMLMSFLNMKLRDGEYDSLEDLCSSLDIDVDKLKQELASSGFEYFPEIKQFR